MPSSIPTEIINWSILNEIVSMDEDDPEFSKGLIIQFIDQAQTTFDEMQTNLDSTKDLKTLDNLGHFLKGSSAALGLQRIAWVCERIQNLGRRRENSFPNRELLIHSSGDTTSREKIGASSDNDNGSNDVNEDSVYLNAISQALTQARYEFVLARKELSKYYGEEL